MAALIFSSGLPAVAESSLMLTSQQFLKTAISELQRMESLRIDEAMGYPKIRFTEYAHIVSLLVEVGKIEKLVSMQPDMSSITLSPLIEKTRKLMIPFFRTMKRDSSWCKGRIKSIKEYAERNADKTLLKVIQIAEDLENHEQSLRMAKGDELEFFYPTIITSCELPAFAIGRVFSETTPSQYLHILQRHSKEKTITDSTAFLRSQFGLEDQNLFICGFQGPKAKGIGCTSVNHWIVIEEEKIENKGFRYRLFFSYIAVFDLNQFLACQPLETEEGIWISQQQMLKVLDSIDRFIDIKLRWTSEMTEDYFNLFGGKGLERRETEDFVNAEDCREVHVININRLRNKIQASLAFKRKMMFMTALGLVSYVAVKFFSPFE